MQDLRTHASGEADRTRDAPGTDDQAISGDPAWLLVTGAPRSGTSLLRALLTAHPSVALLQEYGLTDLIRRIDAIVARPPPASEDWHSPGHPDDVRFNAACSFYRDRPDPPPGRRGGGDPGPEHFKAVAGGLFGGMFPGRALRIVGDKMPIGPAWEDLPFLFERLPGFRIVAMVRNPADTVRSSLVRREATRRGRDAWPIRTVQDAMAQWVSAWRTVQSLKDQYGPAVAVIKYETLCARPQETVDALYGWLGLPPHPVSLPISSLPPDFALHSTDEQAALELHLGPVIEAWPDADAETLMSAFGALASPLVFDEPIRLSDSDADRYLVSGFSFLEKWGRWTDGACAVLAIPHGLTRGLIAVEIGVMQAFAPNGRPCNVVVRCGWSEPKLFQLPPGQSRIAFTAQAEEAEDPGKLILELAILRPKRPGESPADDRALGILVETLTVSQVPSQSRDAIGALKSEE